MQWNSCENGECVVVFLNSTPWEEEIVSVISMCWILNTLIRIFYTRCTQWCSSSIQVLGVTDQINNLLHKRDCWISPVTLDRKPNNNLLLLLCHKYTLPNCSWICILIPIYLCCSLFWLEMFPSFLGST